MNAHQIAQVRIVGHHSQPIEPSTLHRLLSRAAQYRRMRYTSKGVVDQGHDIVFETTVMTCGRNANSDNLLVAEPDFILCCPGPRMWKCHMFAAGATVVPKIRG